MEQKDVDFADWLSGKKTSTQFEVKKPLKGLFYIICIIVGVVVVSLFVWMLYASNYNASF